MVRGSGVLLAEAARFARAAPRRPFGWPVSRVVVEDGLELSGQAEKFEGRRFLERVIHHARIDIDLVWAKVELHDRSRLRR